MMTPGNQRAFVRIAAGAAALWLGLGVIAVGHADRLSGARSTRHQVDAQNRTFAETLTAFKPKNIRFLGGRAATASLVTDKAGRSVVFRSRSTRDRRERVLRAHRTVQILATQLGTPDIVPPATGHEAQRAIGPFFRGQDVMAMAFVGSPFESGDRASGATLDRVPEATRLNAAVIDLLMQHRDRKLANILVAPDGAIRLIDPDRTFVSKRFHPAYRSQFFPGGRLGYRSEQRSLTDLPERGRELVSQLADAYINDVAEAYHLHYSEAEVLRDQARSIRERGLTKAVERYVATLTLKEDR